MRPLISPLERLTLGIFLAFTALLISLNREFAYWHISIHDMPLYSTEAFLGLLATLVLIQPSLRGLLWNQPPRRIFCALSVAFLGLVLIKWLQLWPDHTYIIFRKAALGYYVLTGLVALALVSRLRPETLYKTATAAIIVSNVLNLAQMWPTSFSRYYFYNFAGLPSLIWLGVLFFFLWNQHLVDFQAHPASSALFTCAGALSVVLGGRSVLLGVGMFSILLMIISSGQKRSSEKKSLLIAFLIILTALTLRLTDCIQLPSQDLWKQSFDSQNTFQAVKGYVEDKPATLLSKEDSSSVPSLTGGTASLNLIATSKRPFKQKPQQTIAQSPSEQHIDYEPAEHILFLTSNELGPLAKLHNYSAKINNTLWRLALWKLSSTAVLMYHPWVGFPFGTTVNYSAFGPLSYVTNVDLHNSHLTVLFEFGFIGFALYALLLFSTFRFLWVQWKTKQNGEALAFFCSILFVCWIAFFNVVLEAPYGGPILWGLMGAAIARASSE